MIQQTTSALPHGGVQVGEILVQHRVVGAHPPLWIAHEQTLQHQQTLQSCNQPVNRFVSQSHLLRHRRVLLFFYYYKWKILIKMGR